MSIQAGLLGKERGQAVPVDHVEGAPLSHVDAADAIEGHTVQVALEADGYFVGLVLGAAREIESQPVAQVTQHAGAGHGKETIAAKLLEDDLGGHCWDGDKSRMSRACGAGGAQAWTAPCNGKGTPARALLACS